MKPIKLYGSLLALLFISACVNDVPLNTPTPNVDPIVVIDVDFETSVNGASGYYTLTELLVDFPSASTGVDGIDQNRARIIDSGDSHGRVLQIHYPLNTFGNENGGAQFKVYLDQAYDDLYLAYDFHLRPDFMFVRGGKLPGFAGGDANTGGEIPDGTDGWSARMMWRESGNLVQYVYHPDMPASMGEDFFYQNADASPVSISTGVWHTVVHRIKMNAPGSSNGVMQAWFDGVKVLDQSGMRFRDIDALGIDMFYFSTFFGGSDASWSAARAEYILFDNIRVYREP